MDYTYFHPAKHVPPRHIILMDKETVEGELPTAHHGLEESQLSSSGEDQELQFFADFWLGLSRRYEVDFELLLDMAEWVRRFGILIEGFEFEDEMIIVVWNQVSLSFQQED